MTEVTPGIHWLKLPIPMAESTLTHVNAYLIQGKNGYLLVDTGWNAKETFDTLQKHLIEIGAGIKDISQILVTHIHPDHYGMAGRVRQLSGASIAMHEIEKGFIESRYIKMDRLLEQTDRWLDMNGMPPDEADDLRDATVGLEQYVVPVFPDITLHGGETIDTGVFIFQVLWTPGHSSGHICLYEPEKKVLLSGDHILPTITPNISQHPQSIENPLGRYIKSLQELRQLNVELILPGHDEPFTEFRPRIDEIIRHHEQRNQEILTAVKAETKTAYQIALEVTWGISGRWQDLPAFHKRMAVFETLAHLELMTANRQTEKLTKKDIIYYRQR